MIPCLLKQSLHLSWQIHISVFQSQVCLPFQSAPTSAGVPDLSRNYRTEKGLPPCPHGHPWTLQPRPSAAAPNPSQGNLRVQITQPQEEVPGYGTWLTVHIGKYFPPHITQTLQGCFITTQHPAVCMASKLSELLSYFTPKRKS